MEVQQVVVKISERDFSPIMRLDDDMDTVNVVYVFQVNKDESAETNGPNYQTNE